MANEFDSREIRLEEVIRAQIVEVGRRLYLRNYVASNDGNISVRLGNNHLITTPKSVSKGFMTPDMLVVTDLSGRKISGDRDQDMEGAERLYAIGKGIDSVAADEARWTGGRERWWDVPGAWRTNRSLRGGREGAHCRRRVPEFRASFGNP